MRLRCERAAFSSVSCVEDDVEGGSQSVRENGRLLRSSLKGEIGQVY